MSLSEALELSSEVGFVFTADNPYVGIDIDDCISYENGRRVCKKWAVNLLQCVSSYAEVSASGNGLHVIARGKVPDDVPCHLHLAGQRLELYDSGRQFRMTGNRVGEDVVNEVDICTLLAPWIEAAKVPEAIVYSCRPVRSSVLERAKAYVSKRDYSISGQQGHLALWRVAVDLVRGFALDEGAALDAISEWNQRYAKPPWSEKDLLHKLQDARGKATRLPVGYLRDAEDPNSVNVTRYHEEFSDDDLEFVEHEICVKSYLASVNEGVGSRLSTGIPELDLSLGGGYRRGEMVVVQGRPSHGKTALGLHFAYEAAGSGPVLFISKEMSRQSIGQRLVQRAFGREPMPHEIPDALRAWSDITGKHKVYFCDRVSTIDHAMAHCRKAWYELECGLVIVDYLQLFHGKGQTSYERATYISQQLASLRQLGMSCVVMSQMNRGIEGREGFSPKSSDARDSGQIEQDCDVQLSVVWQCRATDKDGVPVWPNCLPNDYLIFVHKNRNGAIYRPIVDCQYDPVSQWFSSSLLEPINGEDPVPETTGTKVKSLF